MSNEITTPVNENYDENSIQVLEGLEAVRKRPGMYIGSTGERGLHHLVYEIVDNSIDEALAGYCDKITVELLDDGIIRVADNGRGIPVGINPQKGIPTVTVVFTILHAGGKFGGSGYKVSGGLHGVGASVVNALSSWLEVEVCNGENIYKQRYEQGNIATELEIVGKTDKTGTTVTFMPDPSIFTDTTRYDFDTLLQRLREQAFLNAGIRVVLIDKRSDADIPYRTEDLHFEGGIKSYVEYLLEKSKKDRLNNDVIYLSGSSGDSMAEIALLWSTAYDTKVMSFANTIHTIDGGTHESSFKTSLARVVNKYGRNFKFLKEADNNLKGEDISEGLIAVVSVKLTDAQFESQTKAKLGNTAIGTLVNNIVADKLMQYLEEHPAEAKIILDKSIASSNAREAAQKARDLQRNKSGIGGKTRMPEKLKDCISDDPTKTEIFIVEGDSAGGSAVEGRNSTYQAILPLWGKMLNVEKARVDKVYGNDKLTPVVVALGTGIAENFDISKLRYDKIVIMADADVDGSHIRTLLLTFFFRYMPELIETGHIYLAQPPLYRVAKGKKYYDAFTDEERDRFIEELGGNVDVQRYKGLGEMNPEQLWETTLDPEHRTMLKVTMADAQLADETFTMLMGEEVEPRRKFIEENAIFATDLDI
ncbi:MAG: DNA topoisomerase (ATP-hydrolyzing) subunit B [Clostridia bacterium]|nr:DNA topoisomerase (ATP-hydrolyzing) subunit B [Clostridia bacterium]MBR6741681.1 DNA topoisomerase (ATP-hydrolyzing) subunit B [Clostridia bacterium]